MNDAATIRLADDRRFLYQWDRNQKLCITGDVTQIHFLRDGDTALPVDVVNGYADIPPQLLQSAGSLVCWAWDGDRTRIARSWRIEERQRPDDYVYTPEEVATWSDMVERADAALKQAKSASAAANSVRADADAGLFVGAKGDTGPTGPQGETGPRGERGETGPSGLDLTAAQTLTQTQIETAKQNIGIDMLEETVDELSRIVGLATGSDDISWAAIQQIVRSGLAQKMFSIGDQINVAWRDNATGTEYTVPLDVVHFGNVETEDGQTKPGMFLQWHYTAPFGVQFSNYQAFYYCESELPAGTYCVTIGENWSPGCVKNSTCNFTLTQSVPAGGQLAGFRGVSGANPTTLSVYSYADRTTATPQETVSISEGASGTSLGTLTFARGVLNGLQSVAYGYNRWSMSALRQFLNSDGAVGTWWIAQHDYDRPPNELSQKCGFLSGFDSDFSGVLTPIKVTTNLNTVTDNGAQEITYDKFFLPSLEQMYIAPQLAGEGEFWEYWKQALGTESTVEKSGTYPELKTYAIDAQTTAQYVRLRSALRGYSYLTWFFGASGGVYGSGAILAYRFAPACVIC